MHRNAPLTPEGRRRLMRVTAQKRPLAHVRDLDRQNESAGLHHSNIHYNYHRAHTAIGDQPPASATPHRVTNLQMQNT